MKIFFDNENPRGAEKKIFARIMIFLYENLFFNGMAKNHNFRGAKRKILMKHLFLMEIFFSSWISGEGHKKRKRLFPDAL